MTKLCGVDSFHGFLRTATSWQLVRRLRAYRRRLGSKYGDDGARRLLISRVESELHRRIRR